MNHRRPRGRGLCARAAACAVLASQVWALPPAAAQAAAKAEPQTRHTRHALVIGIGEYFDQDVPALPGVPHDMASAQRMARAMAVPDEQVTVLRDGDATADRIRAEIQALARRTAEGDRVFIYYSGHGTRWFDAAAPGDGCTEGLLAADGKVLTNTELAERLAPLARRADKMLVFYDACFSGGMAADRTRSRGATAESGIVITPKFTRAGAPAHCAQPSNFRPRSLAAALQDRQALPQNVLHIAASRPDEVSFDSSAIGGFATVAWRDCLLGQARDLDGSGAITADEVTQCAQARLSASLAGQPGILGQQFTLAGNASFVPVWAAATPQPAALAAAASLLALQGLEPTQPAKPTAPPAVPTVGAAAATAAAAVAPAAVLAELHAQRDGSRSVVATVRQPRMRIGRDALELDITPARDGHLYVALAGSDGKSLYLLYPNALDSDNRVRAGQRVSLPGRGWEIVAGGPPGPETLLVMVTDAPRDLSALAQEKSDKAGPFMKTLLDAQGRSRLQSVLANGTPATACKRAAAAGCSDAFGAALLKVETVQP